MKKILIGLLEVFLVIYFSVNILIGLAVNSSIPTAGDGYYIVAFVVLIFFLGFNFYLRKKRKSKSNVSNTDTKD